MPKSPSLRSAALFLAVAALGMLGCVDKPASGDTTGTALYVYDNASGSVKVWKDVNAQLTLGTAGTPDREITAGAISNRAPLGWGGLAMDSNNNRLYVVGEDGVVARIEKAGSQNGALTQTTDVSTFTLGNPSSDRLPGGSVFGQACVDQSGVLYVAESSADRSSARIWRLANPGGIANQGTADLSGNTLAQISGDKGFPGVAAGSSSMVYAFFPGGETVYDSLGLNGQDGPRLRGARAGAFAKSTGVLIGSATLLSDGSTTTLGSLGYDYSNDVLYVLRKANNATLPAVLVFTADQIASSTMNAAPSRSLGDLSNALPNLRFISHAGTKDWLAGGDMVGTDASNVIYLWKAPSSGGKAATLTLGSSVKVRGMALDGKN